MSLQKKYQIPEVFLLYLPNYRNKSNISNKERILLNRYFTDRPIILGT